MGVANQIDRGDPENIHLEYTSKEANGRKIARELVAMANADGGTVVIGVRDDVNGAPDEFENVNNTDDIARSAADVLYERVEPPLEFDSEHITIDGCTLLALTADSSNQLRSYSHSSIDEPVFPVRRQTEVRYLSGNDINNHYDNVYSDNEGKHSDELLRLSDEELDAELDTYFIEAPDGHISEICLFSNRYYPGDPTRIRLSDDYIPEQKAEHIFACLDAIFEIHSEEAYFTLNQENGAWVGRGYYNFISNLRNRIGRYGDIIEQGYNLDLYGNEQAVLTANILNEYSEFAIIIYAAPFSNEEGYRHLTINFLINGEPVDVRPLIEFSERANLFLDTSHRTEITSESVRKPSRIPVDVDTHTTRPGIAGEGRHVDGAICSNPFFGRDQLLQKELDIENVSPLGNYSKLHGFLRHWDDHESPREYQTRSFSIIDWGEFTEGIYANVLEINFSLNW